MPIDTTKPMPFTLQPRLVERIWGEQRLGPWYEQPTEGRPVGEVWLTAEECVVEAGLDCTDWTLGRLAQEAPAALGNQSGDGFPLLVKVLYPKEKLSVQVHPDDAQAKLLGQPRGKTECWYVLAAEPGAKVAVGFAADISMPEVKLAIEDGSIEEKLCYLPVKGGDMVFVDANTVHAIGPGMVVLETQQYSDVTYRLWDYGRPRELHVEAGLAVTRTKTEAGLVKPVEHDGFTRLVECDYFVVDRFAAEADSRPLGLAGTMQILIALEERCTLELATGESFILNPGHAVIVPAGTAPANLRCTDDAGDLIRIAQSGG